MGVGIRRAKRHDRIGTSENGIWDKDWVRIEIHGPACVSVSTDFKNPYEEVEWNIDRIRKLYNLTLLQSFKNQLQIRLEIMKSLNP